MSARDKTPRRRSVKRELHVVATAVPRDQPDIPRLIRLLMDFARAHDLGKGASDGEERHDGQN